MQLIYLLFSLHVFIDYQNYNVYVCVCKFFFTAFIFFQLLLVFLKTCELEVFIFGKNYCSVQCYVYFQYCGFTIHSRMCSLI